MYYTKCTIYVVFIYKLCNLLKIKNIYEDITNRR